MKLLFRLLIVVIAGTVCGIVGWIVGAYIGGNYAVDFTFNGVRGYEAVGQLGFIFDQSEAVFCVGLPHLNRSKSRLSQER
jgi:hypothetical protein